MRYFKSTQTHADASPFVIDIHSSASRSEKSSLADAASASAYLDS